MSWCSGPKGQRQTSIRFNFLRKFITVIFNAPVWNTTFCLIEFCQFSFDLIWCCISPLLQLIRDVFLKTEDSILIFCSFRSLYLQIHLKETGWQQYQKALNLSTHAGKWISKVESPECSFFSQARPWSKGVTLAIVGCRENYPLTFRPGIVDRVE